MSAMAHMTPRLWGQLSANCFGFSARNFTALVTRFRCSLINLARQIDSLDHMIAQIH